MVNVIILQEAVVLEIVSVLYWLNETDIHDSHYFFSDIQYSDCVYV